MYLPRHNGMDHSMGDDMPGTSTGSHGMAMYVHGGIGNDVLWFASWQPSSAGATVGVCVGLFLLAILDRYVHALHRACSAAWSRGIVGFSLPVSRGDLPAPPLTDSSADVSTGLGSARDSPGARARAVVEKEKDAPGNPTCQCGCGGECGTSSGAHTCCGAECPPSVPEYASLAEERRLGASTAHLPAAVRASLDPRRQGRWSRPWRFAVDVPRGLLYALLSLIHFLLMLTVMTYQLWWIISVVVGLGVGECLFGRFGATRV